MLQLQFLAQYVPLCCSRPSNSAPQRNRAWEGDQGLGSGQSEDEFDCDWRGPHRRSDKRMRVSAEGPPLEGHRSDPAERSRPSPRQTVASSGSGSQQFSRQSNRDSGYSSLHSVAKLLHAKLGVWL